MIRLTIGQQRDQIEIEGLAFSKDFTFQLPWQPTLA